MTLTQPYAQRQFDYFNTLIWNGELPRIPLVIVRARSFLGKCCYVRTRSLFSEGQARDFSIRLSCLYDLDERTLQDVIIHEMIHYYIGVNGYRDTAPHGKLFKQLMNEINEKFGRNVTISAKTSSDKAEETNGTKAVVSRPPVKHRYRFVAILTYKDGSRGFKVLPSVYKSIVKYCTVAASSSEFDKVDLYQSCNDFFGRYPSSAALKVYSFSEGEYEKVMEGAVPMVIKPECICSVYADEAKE